MWTISYRALCAFQSTIKHLLQPTPALDDMIGKCQGQKTGNFQLAFLWPWTGALFITITAGTGGSTDGATEKKIPRGYY